MTMRQAMSQPMPAGRPTDYNLDVVERVCTAVAEGKSLRSICRQTDMPAISTVMKWLVRHEEFVAHYARACEARTWAHGDDAIVMADTPLRAENVTTRPDGK